MRHLFLFLGALTTAATCAFGRLGENEVQSKARYGDAVPELIGANDKPLIPGATELAYNFEGWRVRAAFIDGITRRIEYIKLPEGGQPKPLTDIEVQALLTAEAGKFKWREERPRTGYESLNKLQTAVEGRKWARNDHAAANLKANLIFTFESRDVDKLEKKLGKPGTTPQPKNGGFPKF